ncbi:hypothetical protein NESM_000735900 [Novymonas esmeraldas]|uniref:Uncharacterized protein n=1 Tax=Novymonas esmeraldas TaxID=1808958 RepID=A0AAW0EWC3_9TRYP
MFVDRVSGVLLNHRGADGGSGSSWSLRLGGCTGPPARGSEWPCTRRDGSVQSDRRTGVGPCNCVLSRDFLHVLVKSGCGALRGIVSFGEVCATARSNVRTRCEIEAQLLMGGVEQNPGPATPLGQRCGPDARLSGGVEDTLPPSTGRVQVLVQSTSAASPLPCGCSRGQRCGHAPEADLPDVLRERELQGPSAVLMSSWTALDWCTSTAGGDVLLEEPSTHVVAAGVTVDDSLTRTSGPLSVLLVHLLRAAALRDRVAWCAATEASRDGGDGAHAAARESLLQRRGQCVAVCLEMGVPPQVMGTLLLREASIIAQRRSLCRLNPPPFPSQSPPILTDTARLLRLSAVAAQRSWRESPPPQRSQACVASNHAAIAHPAIARLDSLMEEVPHATVAATAAESARLRKELAAAGKGKAAAEAESARLTAELAAAGKGKAAAEAESARLTAELAAAGKGKAAAEAESARVRKELAAAGKGKAAAEAESARLTAELAAAGKGKAAAEAESARLTAELAAAGKGKAAAEAESARLTTELAAAGKGKAAAEAESARVRKELAAAGKGKAAAEAESARLTAELAAAGKGKAAAEAESARVRKELAAAGKGKAAAEAESARLTTELAAAGKGKATAEAESARVRKELAAAGKGKAAAEAESARLTTELAAAGKGKAAAEAESARLRTELAAEERTVSLSLAMSQSTAADVEQLRREFTALTDHVVKLQMGALATGFHSTLEAAPRETWWPRFSAVESLRRSAPAPSAGPPTDVPSTVELRAQIASLHEKNAALELGLQRALHGYTQCSLTLETLRHHVSTLSASQGQAATVEAHLRAELASTSTAYVEAVAAKVRCVKEWEMSVSSLQQDLAIARSTVRTKESALAAALCESEDLRSRLQATEAEWRRLRQGERSFPETLRTAAPHPRHLPLNLQRASLSQTAAAAACACGAGVGVQAPWEGPASTACPFAQCERVPVQPVTAPQPAAAEAQPFVLPPARKFRVERRR